MEYIRKKAFLHLLDAAHQVTHFIYFSIFIKLTAVCLKHPPFYIYGSGCNE